MHEDLDPTIGRGKARQGENKRNTFVDLDPTIGKAALPEEEKGFVPSLSEKFGKRVDAVKGAYGRAQEKGITGIPTTVPQVRDIAAGQIAGGVHDIIGEGLSTALKAGAGVVPDVVKTKVSEGVTDLLQSDIGQLGMKAINAGQEAYSSFKEANPDFALQLEGGLNVVGLGVGSQAAKVPAREAKYLAKDLQRMHAKASGVDQIGQIVKRDITKAITPSVAGKKTFSGREQYFKKATEAVKGIVENKQALKLTDEIGEVVENALPQNLSQFAQAIEQSKKAIFTKYDDLASQTGGRQIGTANIEKDIQNYLGKIEKLAIPNKAQRNHANEWLDRLKTKGSYTAQEAQDVIKELNVNSITKIGKSRSDAAAGQIDEIIAKRLRADLDDIVTKATGGDYKKLKTQYGALKTIEDDVAKRLNREVNKMVGSSFGDVASDITAVTTAGYAALSSQPQLFALAGAPKLVNFMRKISNNPNSKVARIFKKVDKIMDIDASVPASSTFKALQNIVNRVQRPVDLSKFENVK